MGSSRWIPGPVGLRVRELPGAPAEQPPPATPGLLLTASPVPGGRRCPDPGPLGTGNCSAPGAGRREPPGLPRDTGSGGNTGRDTRRDGAGPRPALGAGVRPWGSRHTRGWAGGRWLIACRDRGDGAAPGGGRDIPQARGKIKGCFGLNSEQAPFRPGLGPPLTGTGPRGSSRAGHRAATDARPVTKGGAPARSSHGGRDIPPRHRRRGGSFAHAQDGGPRPPPIAALSSVFPPTDWLPVCKMAAQELPVPAEAQSKMAGTGLRRPQPRWRRTRSGGRRPPRRRGAGWRSRLGWRPAGWGARRSSCCGLASLPWCGRRC